ncbi:MAG TPA: hypothetical protein VFV48_02570 [Pseudomonadales bacterium]|nr:hypothetical protein [Pseudomonadales bacterium]
MTFKDFEQALIQSIVMQFLFLLSRYFLLNSVYFQPENFGAIQAFHRYFLRLVFVGMAGSTGDGVIFSRTWDLV